MLRMPAIVTPQDVINHCSSALTASGCGRARIMNDLPRAHFAFNVTPEHYEALRPKLLTRLTGAVELTLPGGGLMTIGQQTLSERPLTWYAGQPFASLALVTDPQSDLEPGGGYVVVADTNLRTPSDWLRRNNVSYEQVELYNQTALRVHLSPPHSSPGMAGLYGLYVALEPVMPERHLPRTARSA